MSKTELNVLFKKIQKDDKKEVLEFHVQGESLPNSQELVQMAGNIVVLDVVKSEAGKFNAKFKSIQRDSKKTSLKINVKGDNDDKSIKLYPLAGSNTVITLEESQMSIDKFYDEEHEGIEYQLNQDGTVDVNKDQMSIDDVGQENDEDELFD